MKKVLLVFGTRPEAIKMCPLVIELKKRKNFEVIVCVTAQHRYMLDQVLEIFNIVPDYDLSIMKKNQSLFDISINILSKFKNILIKEKPDIILVHGDTSTTLLAAMSAYYLRIPVGHVEAGLRTYNIFSPYPEEFNRQAVSIISNYNFAPTKYAADNLIHEKKNKESIFVTGNTVIDAMKYTVSPNYKHPELDWVGENRLIFVTAHRRENIGAPMHSMFKAIRRVLDEIHDLRAIFPIHLNPIIREIAEYEFKGCNNIHLIEPIDVIDCHNFESRCYVCLTDSGGIQEECPTFGKPVLVMRNTTERPEGIEAGVTKLVGNNEKIIYDNFKKLVTDKNFYNNMSKKSNPYGDGNACIRIANILEDRL